MILNEAKSWLLTASFITNDMIIKVKVMIKYKLVFIVIRFIVYPKIINFYFYVIGIESKFFLTTKAFTLIKFIVFWCEIEHSGL